MEGILKKRICLQAIREEAEAYYRNGDFIARKRLWRPFGNTLMRRFPLKLCMASGFPVGVGGAKCICGALSGGVMCLGYFLVGQKPKENK